jgi:hypothetical protein
MASGTDLLLPHSSRLMAGEPPRPRQRSKPTATAAAPRRPARSASAPAWQTPTDIFDKLTDPSQYTGLHKKRFDGDGKGRGLSGRRDSVASVQLPAAFADVGRRDSPPHTHSAPTELGPWQEGKEGAAAASPRRRRRAAAAVKLTGGGKAGGQRTPSPPQQQALEERRRERLARKREQVGRARPIVFNHHRHHLFPLFPPPRFDTKRKRISKCK